MTFRHYILHKKIPTPSELQEQYFLIIPIDHEDYILGIADLTLLIFQPWTDHSGELMRRAINSISTRQGRGLAIEICSTLRELRSSFQRIYVPLSNVNGKGFAGIMTGKLEVMKASVSKVEDACYNMHVRGSEKPDWWIMDLNRDERPKRYDKEGSDEEDIGRDKRRRLNDD